MLLFLRMGDPNENCDHRLVSLLWLTARGTHRSVNGVVHRTTLIQSSRVSSFHDPTGRHLNTGRDSARFIASRWGTWSGGLDSERTPSCESASGQTWVAKAASGDKVSGDHALLTWERSRAPLVVLPREASQGLRV